MNIIKASAQLKRGRDHALSRKHHWLFSGAVERIEGDPSEGDLIWVLGKNNRQLAYGFYGDQSISIRILSFNPKLQPNEQILNLLKEARKKRKKIGLTTSTQTDSYRIFHSEGDGLPGLTIDKFASIIVIQLHHSGLIPFLDLITNYLLQKFPMTESIILKTGKSKEEKDNYKFLLGDRFETIIKENGINFKVNILEGQKTGFFLDQRDNREKLAEVCENKSVLNLFCFSGGFSIYALANGANKVVSVDRSKTALLEAEENIKLSNLEGKDFTFINDDCEKFLTETKEKFDVVICDPPALVKNKNHLPKGLRYYQNLQKLALSRTKLDSYFLTFSCSQFVNENHLKQAVLKAATDLNLKLELKMTLSQSKCHTINPNHPESKYLKGFMFQVIEI